MNYGAQVQFGYDPYASHPDTAGLFSSIKKAVKSVGKTVAKVASAPERLAVSAAQKAGIPGAKYAVMALAPGLSQTTQGGQVVKGFLTSGNLRQLAANAQQALKNAGPAGMVASGALGAMQAGLSGKNLESIAWAAAEGAAPAGIDTAIRAAEALRHGQSVLTVALNAAQQSFTPGSTEAFGFQTAIDTLKKNASKIALGVARSALPSEGARRAFDAAVGVVSKAATMNASSLNNLIPRPGIPNITIKSLKAPLSAVPSATKGVVDAIRRNPSLMTGSHQLLAQAMRTNGATVLDAVRQVQNSGKPLLPWRSLAPNTVAFVRRYMPNAPLTALRHAHTNVGGLDSAGTGYVVEKGDGPWAIAQKLTGNGNRWKELLDYNKDKKPTVDKNIWVGEVLNLPPSWQKPVAIVKPPTTTLPAAPSIVPTIAPVTDVVSAATQAANNIIPGVLQAKALLATWGKTDGINQAGLTDYGLNPADLSTTMGPRDTLMLQSFQVWDNKTLNDGLNVTGNLDAKSLAALQSWAAARATAAVPPSASATPTPIVSSPGLPAVSVPALPSVDPLPVVIPAGVIGGTDSNPAAPKVATTAQPASGGSGGVIAGGAIIGGLLFGVPGALIGAAAGAAIS